MGNVRIITLNVFCYEIHLKEKIVNITAWLLDGEETVPREISKHRQYLVIDSTTQPSSTIRHSIYNIHIFESLTSYNHQNRNIFAFMDIYDHLEFRIRFLPSVR